MKGFFALALGLGLIGLAAAGGSAQNIGALEDEMIRLVDGVSESIVAVAAHSGQMHEEGRKQGSWQATAKTVGCGIVFDEGGLVITTASVVGYARSVELSTRDGVKYKGTVIGVDPSSDIAVIKADDADLKVARFADQVRLLPGSIVLVLGNAFGTLPSVSMGMVSNLTAAGDEVGTGSMFALSVPINPGDIGGPVVNTDGEVIGMVIGRLSFQSQPQAVRIGDRAMFGFGGPLQPSNMSIAIPASRVLGIAAELLEKGSNRRGFLGVTVVALTNEMKADLGDASKNGVMVMDVVAGSPAESIGIVPGDIITAVGSKDIETVTQLGDVVRAIKPGEVVEIEYSRRGHAVRDGVRIGWFVPEYVRQAGFGEYALRPEQVRARIENLKTEMEVLETHLKKLEAGE